MRYLFDIDGTLARTDGMEYERAEPIWHAVREVRRLHSVGHTVHIRTCRGWRAGDDWYERTRRQLLSWGLREGAGYDRLTTGVEFYHRVIDDRAVNAADWRRAIRGYR